MEKMQVSCSFPVSEGVEMYFQYVGVSYFLSNPAPLRKKASS